MLTLRQGDYEWQFVQAAGAGSLTDSGVATCR
jgi:hypothetical protein